MRKKGNDIYEFRLMVANALNLQPSESDLGKMLEDLKLEIEELKDQIYLLKHPFKYKIGDHTKDGRVIVERLYDHYFSLGPKIKLYNVTYPDNEQIWRVPEDRIVLKLNKND